MMKAGDFRRGRPRRGRGRNRTSGGQSMQQLARVHRLRAAEIVDAAVWGSMATWGEGAPAAAVAALLAEALDGMLALAGWAAEQQGFEIAFVPPEELD